MRPGQVGQPGGGAKSPDGGGSRLVAVAIHCYDDAYWEGHSPGLTVAGESLADAAAGNLDQCRGVQDLTGRGHGAGRGAVDTAD